MTTTVIRAIMSTLQDAETTPLDSWGRRPDARGDAQTSGKSLLAHDAVPVVGLTGIWESTPGSWHVDARPLTEVAVILSGRGRLTDTDGYVHDLGAGDVLVLPAGWSGEWTILDVMRKLYVVAPEATP